MWTELSCHLRDLMKHCVAVAEGKETAPELLGNLYQPITDADLGDLLSSLPPVSCSEPVHPHEPRIVQARE